MVTLLFEAPHRMSASQETSRIAEPAFSEGRRFTVEDVAQAPCCLDAQVPGQTSQAIDTDQLERGLPAVRRRV